jgi:IS6 family transposase
VPIPACRGLQPWRDEDFFRQQYPYIKVKGQWYYLYRAVDEMGQTIDFLLTAQRDEQAAMRFLTKAIRPPWRAGEGNA